VGDILSLFEEAGRYFT